MIEFLLCTKCNECITLIYDRESARLLYNFIKKHHKHLLIALTEDEIDLTATGLIHYKEK